MNARQLSLQTAAEDQEQELSLLDQMLAESPTPAVRPERPTATDLFGVTPGEATPAPVGEYVTVDVLMGASAPVIQRSAPTVEPEREDKRPAVSKPARRSIRIGDFVFYTSKAGKTKRYRVAGQGRNGVVWLQMLGHFGGDPLKGKRFPVRLQDVRPDNAPDNGSRYCTVCGERSCNIGPFARG